MTSNHLQVSSIGFQKVTNCSHWLKGVRVSEKVSSSTEGSGVWWECRTRLRIFLTAASVSIILYRPHPLLRRKKEKTRKMKMWVSHFIQRNNASIESPGLFNGHFFKLFLNSFCTYLIEFVNLINQYLDIFHCTEHDCESSCKSCTHLTPIYLLTFNSNTGKYSTHSRRVIL